MIDTSLRAISITTGLITMGFMCVVIALILYTGEINIWWGLSLLSGFLTLITCGVLWAHYKTAYHLAEKEILQRKDEIIAREHVIFALSNLRSYVDDWRAKVARSSTESDEISFHDYSLITEEHSPIINEQVEHLFNATVALIPHADLNYLIPVIGDEVRTLLEDSPWANSWGSLWLRYKHKQGVLS